MCLAHALIIAMSRVNGDPKYALYTRQMYENTCSGSLETSGVDLSNDRDFEELEQFQEYISD